MNELNKAIRIAAESILGSKDIRDEGCPHFDARDFSSIHRDILKPFPLEYYQERAKEILSKPDRFSFGLDYKFDCNKEKGEKNEIV